MAMMVPVLIFILVAIVEVGRMMTTFLTVEHVTREALRLGITGATDTQIQSRVTTLVPSLSSANMTVTITPAGTRASGTDLTVNITYNYQLLPLFHFLGTSVPLQGSLTARME
jgi:Flp pilus assembly protein TadG